VALQEIYRFDQLRLPYLNVRARVQREALVGGCSTFAVHDAMRGAVRLNPESGHL
jgi:hypothetical protein